MWVDFYNAGKTAGTYAIVQENKRKRGNVNMKKRKGFYLALCIGIMCAGCGSKSVADTGNKEGEGTVSTEIAGYRFPEKYEKTSDSGKVKFNCQLEIPGNMTQAIQAVAVEGLYCCDREKAWAMFGEGRK